LVLEQKGAELRKRRLKASELFSDSVTAELKDLRMAGAELQIDWVTAETPSEWKSHGTETPTLIVKTNAGEGFKPLQKVASGGELSRMMLAIRRVISDQGGIGVYLFDEIDTGMGGQTAFQVGKKLKSVAEHNQVICITHLPQVAAFAHHHLSVRKEELKQKSGIRTVTRILELNQNERNHEIARMLGGSELTEKSMNNAADLILQAQR
jgi:DNA repair protein RecN (Recombination protein N)